jgi:hypothetical protein
VAEVPRRGGPALVGIEERTDASGKKRYRAKVYDKRIGRHRSSPWTRSLAEARAWRIDALAAIQSGVFADDYKESLPGSEADPAAALDAYLADVPKADPIGAG